VRLAKPAGASKPRVETLERFPNGCTWHPQESTHARQGAFTMLRLAALTALTALALALAGTSAHACVVPFVRTFAGHTVDGTMSARSGKPCRIRLRFSRGPTTGARIVARPSNGTVSIGAGNDIVYRSRPGFVGRDQFTYERTGLGAGNAPVTRGVRVSVTVRP
jgi:hypothetical protein